MSVHVMGNVWELNLDPAHKLVLLAMADHADHEGGSVHPSVRLIAYKTGYSERQVQRIMRALEAAKILVVESPSSGGRGHTTHYRIVTTNGVILSPFRKSERVTSATDNSDKMSPFGRERVTSATVKGDMGVTRTIKEPRENDDPFPSTEPPLLGAMRVALCEARGITSLSGKFKADMDAVCRDLLNAGAMPVDVPHLTAWATHHDFWGDAHGTKTSKGYSLKQLPTIYEQWTSAGQPKRRRSVFSNVAPEAR